MRHHTGLSNGFWIYAVKAKLHMYNITLKELLVWPKAEHLTPTSLWVSSVGAHSKTEET